MSVAFPVRLSLIESYIVAKHGQARHLTLSEIVVLDEWAQRIFGEAESAQIADDFGTAGISTPTGMTEEFGGFPVGFVVNGPERSSAAWKRAEALLKARVAAHLPAMLQEMQAAVDHAEIDIARLDAAAVPRQKGSRQLSWKPKILCGWMFWYTQTSSQGAKVTLVVGPTGDVLPRAPEDPAAQAEWTRAAGWTARSYAAGDVIPGLHAGRQADWLLHSEDWRGHSLEWMNALLTSGSRIATASSPEDARASAAGWAKA